MEEDKRVSAVVRSQVIRAKLEVEVKGTVEEIASVFDSVLASVARHFPNMETHLEFGGENQDVEPDAGKTPPVMTRRARAAKREKL